MKVRFSSNFSVKSSQYLVVTGSLVLICLKCCLTVLSHLTLSIMSLSQLTVFDLGVKNQTNIMI